MNHHEEKQATGLKKSARLAFADKIRSLAKQIKDMNEWAIKNTGLLDKDILEDLTNLTPLVSDLEKRALEIERPTAEERQRKWEFGNNRHEAIKNGKNY